MTFSKATEGVVSMGQTMPGKAAAIKRCPECYTNLPFEISVCPWCNQKIQNKIDKHGYGKKPINWSAYLACFFTWAVAILYIWWAFIKN
ncbi:MAG: hypothetical protein JRH18_12990 [Deltaproteobacteria bacterium]|nr:hypothetical protein [Deltaproteobacteria bacterium]MBW1960334.1 hypothetical protein [Deltaproteobacteria bacterium]MBW2152570.1 hypothetical protein [Deltaproteobacteria bacterium]